MKNKLLISAGVVTATLALGTPAFAGEITGGGPNGQTPTPIEGRVAGSECAFSGLEDGDGTGVGPGVTDVAFAAQNGILQGFGPGQNCRGYASGG